MRVLVTGAAGFVGTAVIAHLATEHRVRAADVAEIRAPTGVETLLGDLSDWNVARDAVAGVDGVIHLATGGTRPGATPPSVVRDSVVATTALLEAANQGGCRRFVLMSSGAVVTGYPRGSRINATTPAAFMGLYPLTKHLQEEVARQYAREHGMTVPILRPWVVVDANRGVLYDGTPLGDQADPLAHNGAFGWVDRGDLAAACAAALTRPISGAPVIHLMANALGRVLFDPTPADEMLGWVPRYDFADAVPAGVTAPEPPAASRGPGA
jgi:nucleoside-diphosphate-sugar epimerase